MGQVGKSKYVGILVLILALLIGGEVSFYLYKEIKLNYERYKISAPMQDMEFKKQIIETSHNKYYKLENLRQLVGPEELFEIIKSNNDNPQIYTPSEKNIKNGVFKVNLHMHTIYSDGASNVRYLLDLAQEYAEKNLNGESMYIAITDHNTVLGIQELIRVLQTTPVEEYNRVKIVPGIEVYTAFNNSKFSPKPVEIHVLTWCINPYDEFLNKEFYKKNLADKWNRTWPDRDFDWLVKTMSNYGIVSVAHPARYTTFLEKKKFPYIAEMFERFRSLTEGKLIATEGYYQVYSRLYENGKLNVEYKKYLDYINEQARKNGIFLTGSTDVHGLSLFTR